MESFIFQAFVTYSIISLCSNYCVLKKPRSCYISISSFILYIRQKRPKCLSNLVYLLIQQALNSLLQQLPLSMLKK